MNATLITFKYTSLSRDKKIEIEAKSPDSDDYISISCEYNDFSIQQYSREIHVRDISISGQSSKNCGADKSVTDHVSEYLLSDLRVAFNMTEERPYTSLTTIEETYDVKLSKESTAISDNSFFKMTSKKQLNYKIHSTHKSGYETHPTTGGLDLEGLSRHIKYIFLIGDDYQSQLEKQYTEDRLLEEIENALNPPSSCTVS